MYYLANVVVISICLYIPIYWEGWHENFCKVEFLCYMGEPNWLGYVVFYGILISVWWFLAFWQGPKKGHVDDDR